MHIDTRNVNSAYARLIPAMKIQRSENSRNGPVLTVPVPALVHIRRPVERVLFNVDRDANPTFHMLEALWMLAGRNDVAFVQKYNSRMGEFSDDGITFNAAYGHRWRSHFGFDQLERAAELLRDSNDTRRSVVTIWDPITDLGTKSNDIPCNQQAMFRVVDGRLNMLTTNRSNDLVWGLLGANFVHLTIMMEYMAARAGGLSVGEWTHVSNNLHIYERHWPLMDLPQYSGAEWIPYPRRDELLPDGEFLDFDEDCKALVEGAEDYFKTPFFDNNVAPMVQAWAEWKLGNKEEALNLARCIRSDDWRIATTAWYERRIK